MAIVILLHLIRFCIIFYALTTQTCNITNAVFSVTILITIMTIEFQACQIVVRGVLEQQFPTGTQDSAAFKDDAILGLVIEYSALPRYVIFVFLRDILFDE